MTGPLAAGDFSTWLVEIRAALRGDRDSDVPCAGCTACCTSSQFVHIGPDETDALAHIPAELTFAAPRMPRGHVLLGYDQHGRCPMLVDDRCSIYEHRPKTCRTYDCRVFPAAGIDVGEGDPDKSLIAERASRWLFDYSSDSDEVRHDAVRAAATFLAANVTSMPDGVAPTTATQRAVVAVQLHRSFLSDPDAAGRRTVIDPDPHVVHVELTRRARPAQ